MFTVTPTGLEHVFLADSGSVSVEVALKMAIQYQGGEGRPERTRMLTVRGGYHGDTCGCMGVCDPQNGMHTMFRGFVADHVFADRPPPDEDGVDAWAASFRKLADETTHELAGIIVEPLLQGAGGMYVYPAACLRVMREVARVLRPAVPLQIGWRSDRENTRLEQLADHQPDAGGLAEAHSHVEAVRLVIHLADAPLPGGACIGDHDIHAAEFFRDCIAGAAHR